MSSDWKHVVFHLLNNSRTSTFSFRHWLIWWMTRSENEMPLNTKLMLPTKHKGCEQGTHSNNRSQILLLKLDTGRYQERQTTILIISSSMIIVFPAAGTKISKQTCIQIKQQQQLYSFYCYIQTNTEVWMANTKPVPTGTAGRSHQAKTVGKELRLVSQFDYSSFRPSPL